jgi:hypothetical protein
LSNRIDWIQTEDLEELISQTIVVDFIQKPNKNYSSTSQALNKSNQTNTSGEKKQPQQLEPYCFRCLTRGHKANSCNRHRVVANRVAAMESSRTETKGDKQTIAQMGDTVSATPTGGKDSDEEDDEITDGSDFNCGTIYLQNQKQKGNNR